jgi:AcrR family transcriptional regulator
MPDSPTRRPYNSPLRARQAEETGTQILAALERLLARQPETDVSFDLLAEESGVQRRTIFRHFPTREALFDAFWLWFNDRHGFVTTPARATDLIGGPRQTFPRFDALDGVIRASLHTPSGRAMRARVTPRRRAAFAAALAERLAAAPPAARARAEALAHLLYSAAAWEVLRDFGGLDGRAAGEAASWALETLIRAATEQPTNEEPE